MEGIMSSQYILRYREGENSWQELPLYEGDLIIGRGEDTDLRLKSGEISRHHAQLSLIENQLRVTDLGSMNGIIVDGEKIPPNHSTSIKPGQFFVICNFTLVVDAPADFEETPPEVPEPVVLSGYILRYQSGSGPFVDYPLVPGEVVIGRYLGADLFLDDKSVSRRHARLLVSEDMITITDLGSMNGTQVDGNPLSPRREFSIQPDQVFTIGCFSLHLSVAEKFDIQHATMEGDIAQLLPPDLRISSRVWEEVRPLDFQKMERIAIGRATENDIVLVHPLVSRYHALIERMGTRFRLKDLGSTNGVFVNGHRIQNESWLGDGDTIRVGPSDFVLSGSNLEKQIELGLQLDALHINQWVTKQLNLLQDINLTIKPMEFIALVGMSGAGKSTLLNALSGYWPASHGKVIINNISLYDYYDLFRNDVGYVPQKDIVHTELTPSSALEYVARLRLPSDTSAGERKSLVTEVLSDLDLTERRDVPISRLSGGQLKRVSIGVELLTKPRLFFLDERTSGLDLGTEYEMMKLLRRLADQGRTVILVTHATKNVMLCDKVIFLARGGHLAYFGSPEQGLEFFDGFRTKREHSEKEMEFDDIYRILNDEKRGKPTDWGERYLNSEVGYQMATEQRAALVQQQATAAKPTGRTGKQRVSALRQFMILSARNLNILFQDKVSLALMLAIAPAIGMMDFIWGGNLFDPVEGDAGKIITMWFMAGLITVLVGAISSVREIVKEIEIYKRERAVNLKIAPYVLSKVWIGIVLGVYQAAVLLFFKVLFARPEMGSILGYLGLYITYLLGTLSGYFIGLVISAIAPNQNAAMLLIIIVLVPQFLFAGALLPLDLIPGGEAISVFMPTRWGFESFVSISGIGDQLSEDPCWNLEEEDRKHLEDELKEACPCMGESIFTDCTDFPGILSPDFFDEVAMAALVAPEPEEPGQPTPYPSPTALPTPTRFPSPTPNPTPENPQDMGGYMDLQNDQGLEYQDRIMDQMEGYRVDSQEQGDAYSEARTMQGDDYADSMSAYGDERAEWQESRQKAISSAEGMLESIYDNYNRAFTGSLIGRWAIMVMMLFVFIFIVLVAQKRKDVV
jgi:ABC-type multidrug transport system ATPase subunit